MDKADTLARICADTRAETLRRRRETSLATLQARIATNADAPRGFAHALRRAVATHGFGLIASMMRERDKIGLEAIGCRVQKRMPRISRALLKIRRRWRQSFGALDDELNPDALA